MKNAMRWYWIICANEALKLEAQEVVCYAKLMMMMMIYLAYKMHTSEKNEKIIVGSHCFYLMLCQYRELKWKV